MLFDLIFNGGQLVWLLLCCSVLSCIVFLERYLYFHRVSIDVAQFLEGLSNLIRRKAFAEAQQQCVLTAGPVSRVLYSALMRHDYSRECLRDVVQEAGQLEVPRIERSLRVLLTVAYVAPLIGLLGTLLGLLDTFQMLNTGAAAAAATPLSLSAGIYQSLVTSAAGLIVAIPAYLLYTYLVAKAKNLMHDMERAGIEIVNLIEDSRHQGEIIQFARSSAEGKESKSIGQRRG